MTTQFPVVGMLVDTSVRPYDFKVIQGSGDLGTQIYDSKTNSWEIRSSRLPAGICAQIDSERLRIPNWCRQSSVNCNGLLYIKCDEEEILVYNVNEDSWITLCDPPTDSAEESCDCIGAWQGRLFGFQECYEPESGSVSIWELVNPSAQEWQMYNRMPAEVYEWLTYKQGDDEFVDVQPYASFSYNYVLIYSYICQEVRVERVVLFDLATKSWSSHLLFGELGAYEESGKSIYEDFESNFLGAEYKDSPILDASVDEE